MNKYTLLPVVLVLPLNVQAAMTTKQYQIDQDKIIEGLAPVSGSASFTGKKTMFSFDDENGTSMATLRLTDKDMEFCDDVNLNVKLQVPFDKKKTNDVELLSFDGLSGSTVFSAGLTYKVGENTENAVSIADIWFFEFGFDYSIGSKKFSYVDESDITTKLTENQTNESVNAHFAYYSDNFLAGFKFTNQTSYSEGDKKHLCYQFSENVTQCADFTVGAPKRKTEDLIEFEARRKFVSTGSIVGLNIVHNLEDSVTKVSLPIFFNRIEDAKPDKGDKSNSFVDAFKGFGGGFRVTWDSLSRETRAGFFVSTTMSFLGK